VSRPRSEADRIRRGIQRCLPFTVAWGGDIFRATGLEYANRRDVLTGEGSRKAGARYTPKGAFRTVYGGLDMETALAEVLAHHRRQGLPEAEALPLTFVALQGDAPNILALTDGSVRRILGVSLQRLKGPWRADQDNGQEALTQTLGRLAREAGVQGLLAPSAARPGGRNLVLFPEHLQTGQLRVIH